MNGRRGPALDRRAALRLAGAGAVGLALGATGTGCAPGAGGPPVREFTRRMAPAMIDLAGRPATSWAYDGLVPGPEIRVTEGERIRITAINGLPQASTIHWHGLTVPNAMDGVPGMTQPPIAPEARFTYEFDVPRAGTFWYHSHVGLQLDRGLYGPLIVEPVREALSYDREYTLTLDDWLDDGDGREPDLSAAGAEYPVHLANGRPLGDPSSLEVVGGDMVRLRLINAAAQTTYRFAVEGHLLRVVRTDGDAVEPVDVQTLTITEGERYDVLIRADNPGVHQVAAASEDGRTVLARAVLRYRDAAGSAPPAASRPAELDGRMLRLTDLFGLGREHLPRAAPDRIHALRLERISQEDGQRWTVNGVPFADAEPLTVERGERVRVELDNPMGGHPMHLHGHVFEVDNGTGRGPFKDTVAAQVGAITRFDYLADNPGTWMFHCHDLYHMEQGMALAVQYRP